jgi:hypothetical protein
MRLESVEHFKEKIEGELKRQIQLKEEDLIVLKNDHHKALTEISDLLIELERTRRAEKQLSDKVHFTNQVLLTEHRDPSPQSHYRSREQKRHESPPI